MFSKILVPIDGSKYSDKALDYALDLAKKYSAQLILIHVVTRTIYYFTDGVPSGLAYQELEHEGEMILAKGDEIVKAKGIPSRTELLSGNPAEAVIKESENVDLIVIGCRGLTGIKAFFLGSVSSRVSRYARCPVLIVK